MYRHIVIVILLPLVLLCSGCATLVHGRTQQVQIDSNPTGAEVSIQGVGQGRTPLSLRLERHREGQTIQVAKPGYRTGIYHLGVTTSGWFWGNILSGGLLGSSTDYGSGAMNAYAPDAYFVSLDPENGTTPAFGDSGRQPSARTMDFIVVNYAHLQAEIATGDGEHLSTLYGMLGITSVSAQQQALKRFLDLYIAKPDAPTFAAAVMREFQP